MKEKIEFLMQYSAAIIFTFLICSFVFNIGYFAPLNFKFMGLLTLSDYYEGTAPALFWSLTLLHSFVLPILTYYKDIELILNALHKIINLLNKIKKLNINNKNTREMRAEIFENLIYLIKTILIYLLIMLPSLFFTMWLLSIYAFDIKFAILAYSITSLALILSFVLYAIKKYIGIYVLSIFIFLMITYSGVCLSKKDYKSNSLTVRTYDNQVYLLIRPISKGIIAKSYQKDTIFIKWKDVKMIFEKH